MPPSPPPRTIPSTHRNALKPYPNKLSRQLRLTLFPLDITHRHELNRGDFNAILAPFTTQNSPLAEWIAAFMKATFHKIESLQTNVSGDAVGLALHDPLCIYYCITCLRPEFVSAADALAQYPARFSTPFSSTNPARWRLTAWDEDIRVETSGQWTRGAYIVDRRHRRKADPKSVETDETTLEALLEERSGDAGIWLDARMGNRLGRCLETPGETSFGTWMVRRILGLEEEAKGKE